MNELKIFENPNFGQIRALEQNGEPWFVAADVCRVLEIGNPSDALRRLDEDEKALVSIEGISRGNDKANIVNESGVYALVFGSRKPEAKSFKRWLAHDVVPSIRKHGAYIEPDTLENMIASPEFGIKLLTALKDEKDRNRALEAANSELSVKTAIMAPKAEYFDELVDRNLLTSFRETAKQLDIKERDFIGFLIDKKFIYRDKKGKLMPYAEKNSGLFEVKECFNEKTEWSGTQTLITPKGRETFRLLYLKTA